MTANIRLDDTPLACITVRRGKKRQSRFTPMQVHVYDG